MNLRASYSPKLRGYFGRKYHDEKILHNHNGEKFVYQYPLVQYKVIKGIPIIIGLASGSDVILNVGIHENGIDMDGIYHDFGRTEIKTELVEIGTCGKIHQYEFATPWIALNQKNMAKYRGVDDIEKEELLEQILIGNLISFAKGFNYDVKDRIRVKINVEKIDVKLKGCDMIGFVGSFKSNFMLPNFAGLGRSAARGFGSVRSVV
jgi:hypothetical protein